MPIETVERYNLLKHFIGMLPPNNQAVHESSVLARRHVEYYSPAVMVQALSQVNLLTVLPCCCAEKATDHVSCSMFLTQQGLYQTFLLDH